jgi:hypothetical protein
MDKSDLTGENYVITEIEDIIKKSKNDIYIIFEIKCMIRNNIFAILLLNFAFFVQWSHTSCLKVTVPLNSKSNFSISRCLPIHSECFGLLNELIYCHVLVEKERKDMLNCRITLHYIHLNVHFLHSINY